MESVDIICGSKPDELREMDHITVNGVVFVPKERHDGAKDVMGDYLNDAHDMVRELEERVLARDRLIRAMLMAIPCYGPCVECYAFKEDRGCNFRHRAKEMGIIRP